MTNRVSRRTRVSVYVAASLVLANQALSAFAETRPVLGDERWVCEWTKTSDNWGGTYGNVIVHKKVFMEYNPFVDKDTPQWKRTRMPYGPKCTFAESRRSQIFEKRGSNWYYKGSIVAVYSETPAAPATPAPRPAGTVASPPPNTASANSHAAGLLYKGSNKEGWHNSREFIHPELKIRFVYPEGFILTNTPEAVKFQGPDGQTYFTTSAYNGDIDAYLKELVGRQKNGDKSLVAEPVQIGTTNGLKSARTMATVTVGSQQKLVTAVAFEISPTQAFHFLSISTFGNDSFEVMYSSFRRMSDFEANDIFRRGPG